MAHYGIEAVDRTLDVLDVFVAQEGLLGLADLARATGINKTTLLRVCTTLERRGLLQRGEGARYRLGPMAYSMGKRYERDQSLIDVLAPSLTSLSMRIQETTSYQVISARDTRTCIYRADTAPPVVVEDVQPGWQLPLTVGATARILLAFSDPERDDPEGVRRYGFSVSVEERHEGCVAVSVPVFGPTGALHGALSAFGPVSRLTDQHCRRILPSLVSTATHLSRSLSRVA